VASVHYVRSVGENHEHYPANQGAFGAKIFAGVSATSE